MLEVCTRDTLTLDRKNIHHIFHILNPTTTLSGSKDADADVGRGETKDADRRRSIALINRYSSRRRYTGHFSDFSGLPVHSIGVRGVLPQPPSTWGLPRMGAAIDAGRSAVHIPLAIKERLPRLFTVRVQDLCEGVQVP